jgi:hypothetical protein
MMNKMFVFRTLIVTMMFCVFLWDAALLLSSHTEPWPHRELLLTGALIWIISVFFPQNSDDDWQLT